MKQYQYLLIISGLITIFVSSNVAWYMSSRNKNRSKNKKVLYEPTDKTGQRFLYTPYTDSTCTGYHAMDEAGFDEMLKGIIINDTLEIGSGGKVLQSFGGCNRLIVCAHRYPPTRKPEWLMSYINALSPGTMSTLSRTFGDTTFTWITPYFKRTDVYDTGVFVTVADSLLFESLIRGKVPLPYKIRLATQ